MNHLVELKEYGQSVWLDFIDSRLVEDGGLSRLVEEDGLGGVTSNPTIFQKAIESGSEDARLARLAEEQPWSAEAALFEKLAVETVRGGCDVLLPVYEGTGGADGFVSIEVSPALAHDAEGTVREARRLWGAVRRPNLMIKVPGTPEGVPAIETLTAEGVNVNVTLLFSLEQYEAIANAYIRGLARAHRPGQTASVASFFVSRVDTLVDKRLESIGTPEALALRGKVAVANAKLVYKRFTELFKGAPFEEARRRGAKVQRPLWASTGTKNPAYSDVLYVDELIGPDTVNTLPPATMDAFRDHGKARESVTVGREEAEAALHRLGVLGVDLAAAGEELQRDGVAAFAKSYEGLLAAIRDKRESLRGHHGLRCTMSLGAYHPAVEERLEAWETSRFPARLWEKDPTLWSGKPLPGISDRLGWLDLPKTMEGRLGEIEAFAGEVRADCIATVVLLGMGGSSLAPEVFGRTFPPRPGCPGLVVLDSTHPEAIRGVERAVEPGRTLFLVSSKSGTTLETLSLFRYFWAVEERTTRTPGRHFAAITDRDTPFEALARQRGFRKVFSADTDVGGRYSALTHFGLVPAALLGADIGALLANGRREAEASGAGVPAMRSSSLALGAALGELARAGRDKATFIASPSLGALPAWIEQLVAESTGKGGKGIVPVADESLADPRLYGNDRFFFYVGLEGESQPGIAGQLQRLEAAGHPVARVLLETREELGGFFFLLEAAVASAGAVLGVHPFDQPDVELAKELARKAMADAESSGSGADAETVEASGFESLSRAVQDWLATSRRGDYACLQAYLPPDIATWEMLQEIRLALRERLGAATTAGFGPRFLHSTGQLHKGGPDSGLFLQILDRPAGDLAVPEAGFTFGALIRAQAVGDWMALAERGRRVLRVDLGEDRAAGLEGLLKAIG